jgi:hypothetical protein
MLTWTIKKSFTPQNTVNNKGEIKRSMLVQTKVEFSDGDVKEFKTKQKALEYINNKFFSTYF